MQVTETSGIARFKTVMRMAQAQIDGEKFVDLVPAEFPQLRDDFQEWDGLEHLQMMEFVLLSPKEMKDGHWATVKRCFEAC